MFRKNDRHHQSAMFSSVNDLPPKLRHRLKQSWAGVFYRECFCRLDESLFERLYTDVDSRPNTPVNVLLSFEILKAGNGWSDMETHERFCFDAQVRYAVGYHDFSQGHFELRTVYNFRKRVQEHHARTGEDLLGLAFEQVTDKQLSAFAVDTSKVRMDSTQVASNIRNFSRLQLLVEVLVRVRRMLCQSDRTRYAELLDPYVSKSSTRFVFGVCSEKGREHISRIGRIMAVLVKALAQSYSEDATYALLRRVFEEQFIQDDDNDNDDWRPRQLGEFTSPLVGSPDDQEASMRSKRGIQYRGYAVNVTETCAAENAVQLIVSVQTAPNIMTDVQFLTESVYRLKGRLDIDTCYTDGGYNKESLYRMMQPLGIEHIQTGIQGHPSSSHLGLYRYQILKSPLGDPQSVICPQGQESETHKRRAGRYHAYFTHEQCEGCPHTERCRSIVCKSHRTLIFTDYDMEIAKRRLYIESLKDKGSNPRSAVESTVYSLKRPFGKKVPVRGRRPVHRLMIGSAFMANIRRIHRAGQGSIRPKGEHPAPGHLLDTFFCVFVQIMQTLAPLASSCSVAVAT